MPIELFTFAAVMHQGNVLREYLRVRGITQSSAASLLGVHVNTLRNWMSADTLDARAAELLAQQWPDIVKLIPRPYTSRYTSSHTEVSAVSEAQHTYGRSGAEASTISGTDITTRYLRLLEKYNDLLERFVAQKGGGVDAEHLTWDQRG
jgi:transcriptional regulator with XRE-family HTH domain